MPTLLFIVSRRQPGLYDYLCRQFAAEPDMKVILDRRVTERRCSTSPPGPGDRRRGDRRRNNEVTYQLLTMGYAFARPMAGVLPGGQAPASDG